MATADSTPVPPRVKNITGQRFTRLVAVAFSHMRDTNAYWRCMCDCGKVVTVAACNLKSKHKPVRSCGCYGAEYRKAHPPGGVAPTDNPVHHRPEYSCWRAMITRCTCETTPTFEQYGARGITVCDRWRNSFEDFVADVGPRPTPEHTLDRYPDREGNYEPGNVRWATQTEQQRNRTNNRMLTHEGVTLCLAEWAERTGLRAGTLLLRLNRGWSVADALTKPVRRWPSQSS